MTEPLLLTVKETADLLGLSETTVWTMIRKREIASVGGTGRGQGQRQMRRIERSEALAWIKRNRTPATP
jgi:excisionase family DNA binding protein